MSVNLNINKHNNIAPTITTKIKESQTNICRFTCLTCRTPHYKKNINCEQSPVHLAESAAPSGNSRLHSPMKFGSRN